MRFERDSLKRTMRTRTCLRLGRNCHAKSISICWKLPSQSTASHSAWFLDFYLLQSNLFSLLHSQSRPPTLFKDLWGAVDLKAGNRNFEIRRREGKRESQRSKCAKCSCSCEGSCHFTPFLLGLFLSLFFSPLSMILTSLSSLRIREFKCTKLVTTETFPI